jgi:hypothetical protein
VHIRGAGGEFDGYAEQLTESSLIIQALGQMPEPGEECAIVFYLEGGETGARGKVLEHDPEQRQYRIEISHLDSNGRLLLAGILLEEPRGSG